MGPTATYSQTRFDRNLRRTEEDAVYKFNFDTPKYHIVHNNDKRTKYDVPRAFRSVRFDCCSRVVVVVSIVIMILKVF